jgi:hypothetical protein
VGVLGASLWCALAGSPERTVIDPVPLDLTPRPPPTREEARLEARREKGPARGVIEAVFGPAPHPDIASRHPDDDVKVTFHPDGSAEATKPRAVRGAAGVCMLDRCLTTRGVRSLRPRPTPSAIADRNTPGSSTPTAPPFGQVVLAFGWQPASPTAAAAMLKSTSDQRAEKAVAWQLAALEDARREIGRHLAAIVRDPVRSATEKRRLVFELWDDAMCTAAEPVSEGDPIGIARAATARSIADAVERFVRRSMPRGSPLGYEPREIERLHATRRAGERFSPYEAREAAAR